MNQAADLRHTSAEDLSALLTGTMFVAVGLEMFRHVGLGTGGAAGLGFLLHYGTGLALPWSLAVVNLPFYVFSYLRMGWRFTLKTVAAVTLLSAETWAVPHWLVFTRIDPIFGAIFGGAAIGVGLLILVRHKASLGGIGILALYLQDHHGWRAGKVQMVLDAVILVGTVAFLSPFAVALSVLGAVILNLILALNHRNGRYTGF
ncbi:YitT family protein [Siculibacillus lacustris]|uniref:YitT family protein n=1 Tax=Siculibacillus lacustris TaxID=1549641 RepID=A0A4Q9VYE4_9HYPH|nr:YitT family protein [Siculibacillus lacustris]TBW40458.1 YitT family protein [Siculibacillus lacustris]